MRLCTIFCYLFPKYIFFDFDSWFFLIDAFAAGAFGMHVDVRFKTKVGLEGYKCGLGVGTTSRKFKYSSNINSDNYVTKGGSGVS